MSESVLQKGGFMAGASPWAVLAYIVADDRMAAGDSLDEVAELDLQRLSVAAERAGVPLAAQIDYQNRDGRWRQIFGATNSTTRLREANSNRPEVLRDFLRFGAQECPAEHYVVMLWGHGSGPAGFFSDASQPTPAELGHPLSPRQLANALSNVAGEMSEHESRKRKFDIVLLKACFGATLEIALQLKDAADFLIASQSLIPGQTFWPYPRMFQGIKRASDETNGLMKSEFVARDILGLLGKFYSNEVNRPGKAEVPYSLLKTDGADVVAGALTDLVAAWRAAGSPDLREIASLSAPGGDPGMLDIARFAQTLMDLGEDDIFKTALALRNSISALAIDQEPKPELSAFRGVNVFCHPGYGMRSPARDTANYGVYKRSKLAQFRQDNAGHGTPSWVEIAFHNTAIGRIAEDIMAKQEANV